MKVLLQVWNERICIKEFFSFVCGFFLSHWGNFKAVLIAQTHRQEVILYMPSVVPPFVYLLLNCLRRIFVSSLFFFTNALINGRKDFAS